MFSLFYGLFAFLCLGCDTKCLGKWICLGSVLFQVRVSGPEYHSDFILLVLFTCSMQFFYLTIHNAHNVLQYSTTYVQYM